MGAFVKAASCAEIGPGAGKTVEVSGRKIAIFNLGGKYYAIDDACKHRGGSLGAGDLDGKNIICPLHGWEYDVTTGENLDDPNVKLGCYAVKVEGDAIMVEI
ncbi:MAG TPA: Rieske 2Fe-2S domain-containing protein [Candidatus Binataceae bacterium]|nr:Rieske 2Fe-2S domain-containing protein [Candidatus Binataceae bacterium]